MSGAYVLSPGPWVSFGPLVLRKLLGDKLCSCNPEMICAVRAPGMHRNAKRKSGI